jgi:hypothetical protein
VAFVLEVIGCPFVRRGDLEVVIDWHLVREESHWSKPLNAAPLAPGMFTWHVGRLVFLFACGIPSLGEEDFLN